MMPLPTLEWPTKAPTLCWCGGPGVGVSQMLGCHAARSSVQRSERERATWWASKTMPGCSWRVARPKVEQPTCSSRSGARHQCRAQEDPAEGDQLEWSHRCHAVGCGGAVTRCRLPLAGSEVLTRPSASRHLTWGGQTLSAATITAFLFYECQFIRSAGRPSTNHCLLS